MQDHLAYGFLPTLCYAALIVAVVMIHDGDGTGSYVLAGGLLALMLVNIRNAWDLMLSMVHNQAKRRR